MDFITVASQTQRGRDLGSSSGRAGIVTTDCWSQVHMFINRGERSCDQFRDGLWLPRRVFQQLWFCKQELPLQISIYLNSSRYWVGTNHIY